MYRLASVNLMAVKRDAVEAEEVGEEGSAAVFCTVGRKGGQDLEEQSGLRRFHCLAAVAHVRRVEEPREGLPTCRMSANEAQSRVLGSGRGRGRCFAEGGTILDWINT